MLSQALIIVQSILALIIAQSILAFITKLFAMALIIVLYGRALIMALIISLVALFIQALLGQELIMPKLGLIKQAYGLEAIKLVQIDELVIMQASLVKLLHYRLLVRSNPTNFLFLMPFICKSLINFILFFFEILIKKLEFDLSINI